MSNITACYSFTPERRESVTAAILNAPAEQTHKLVGDAIGVSPETVRKVRFGLMWFDVLPNLPRLDYSVRVRGHGLTCVLCVHWTPTPYRMRFDGEDIRRRGVCDLAIPESVDVRYARGCGAFMAQEQS
jgi:hypothetical protein